MDGAARGLSERRYAGLRAGGAAGWYPDGALEENLREWERLLAPLGLRPERAIELGCGAGNLALHLAGLGWAVAGLDTSAEAVA